MSGAGSDPRGACALGADVLYTRCDAGRFGFASTAELDDIDVVIGQTRALDSIQFGLSIDGGGYNIFALGPAGLGKRTSVEHMARREARRRPAPPDWCYVHNFDRPDRPRALRLPAGLGAGLCERVRRLIDDLGAAIPAAFESEDYRARVEELEHAFEQRQSEAMSGLGDRAKTQRVALMHTPAGFAFAPVDDDGEVLEPGRFEQLPETERRAIESAVETLQRELQKTLRQFPLWAKQTREKIREVNREIAEYAVGHLINGLKEDYAELNEVVDHLDAVRADVIDNVSVFLPRQRQRRPGLIDAPRDEGLDRYRVNLLVDNAGRAAAPVVFEDLPSYANLIGRVEYQAQMGALSTNFTLIKPGALHRANGGFLLLDARRLLAQPFAWDGLKRALRAREIRLDSPERSLSPISTASLEPEHIPLDVKVVLTGDRWLYYLLCERDPEFRELFKVAADFNDSADRSAQSDSLYASALATLARRAELRPLQAGAVARLIEYGARRAADAAKVSTHLGDLIDTLREADHWAQAAGRELIAAADVQRAVDEQIYRAERVRERVYENIRRGTVLIDTGGQVIGQINGLAVSQLGGFAFARPTRITATARLGGGKVIDIERESELGGPLHAKGVMILSGFLASRYAGRRPLAIAASLVFEQSYGPVDGDSASLAELCALLSSLAECPIEQGLAVTGSVNQRGQTQPIGAVNEKIEGFFDVCSAAGLSGGQGVLIPAANVKHLMLRHDVVAAVADGRFRVYAVADVDQAMAILSGCPAGERVAGGNYPAHSVNRRVEDRLRELSDLRRRFAGGADAASAETR